MDILKEIALGKQGYLVNIHSDELNRPKKVLSYFYNFKVTSDVTHIN